jgi:hypothetical protein
MSKLFLYNSQVDVSTDRMRGFGIGVSRRRSVGWIFELSARRHYYAFAGLATTLTNDRKVGEIRMSGGLCGR